MFLDISSYFNKIWHAGLLHKCKQEFFISGPLLGWLASYLANRVQRVRVPGTEIFSSPKILGAGCPQGSVLGPLLALMYLDGLTKDMNCETLLYADDVTILAPYTRHDFDTVRQSLQNELDAIDEYGKRWAITFNATKTLQQTFSHKNNPEIVNLNFGGQNIPRTENHKHLGLVLSKDLRFHQHVNDILKKVNIALSPVYAISKYMPRQLLCQIYQTYIRPLYDYCDIVYDGHLTEYDNRRLNRQQTRISRLITGTPIRTSTDKLRQELGFDSLTTRREIHRLTFFHKFINNPDIFPSYFQGLLPDIRLAETQRNLRNADLLSVPNHHTVSFRRSYFPTTIRNWNTLPPNIRSQTSLALFKREIINLLGCPAPSVYFLHGTKTKNTLHTRLRTDTLPLNAYLYQIQKSSTPGCPCGTQIENTKHFILHCPLYNAVRQTLLNHLAAHNVDTRRPHTTHFLNILTHGITLQAEQGRAVAGAVQNFIVAALDRRNRAVSGEDGGSS